MLTLLDLQSYISYYQPNCQLRSAAVTAMPEPARMRTIDPKLIGLDCVYQMSTKELQGRAYERDLMHTLGASDGLGSIIPLPDGPNAFCCRATFDYYYFDPAQWTQIMCWYDEVIDGFTDFSISCGSLSTTD